MKQYLLRLPLDLWNKAIKKAKKEDLSFAQLVRKLLKNYLK